MEKRNTSFFLELLEKQNRAIAAFDTEKAAADGVDPIREQREAERREKYGELRAREHRGNRPKQIRNAFGHVPLDY